MSQQGRMTALWLEGGRLSLSDDVPVPDPPEGEALLRVVTAGICNTDLEMVRGYSSFTGVPGHEFIGIVEEGPLELVGRRVAGEINASCGKCPACRSGRRNHCPTRTVLGIVGRNGAFARYLTLPAGNLHPIPDSLTTDAAVFIEPLAAALEIQEQVPIRPADRVIVVGDGKLGQLVARTLALTGCDLLVAGRHEKKLDLLAASGVRTRFADAVSEGGFDVAVECTGDPSGFELARKALRPRGTLVMKSTYAGMLGLDASRLVVDEITLIGSRCGPFPKALDLLAGGGIDVLPLIDARFPLSGALAAFDHAGSPGVLKVLVDMEAG
jgi:threonine dehydrogenase-like Zn-dependent dehydrogenase